MSKSSPDIQSRILLTDSADLIKSKIRASVTDSIPGITYDPLARPGTSNLVAILAACTNEDPKEVALRYKNHGELKADVADAIEETIKGPRNEFGRIKKDTAYLLQVAEKGALKARARSDVTMREVRECIGLL
jgi:tryptophanyl-tRNA synthetase